MAEQNYLPCSPFTDLERLGFASREDLNKVFQVGVRGDSTARVHVTSSGQFILSFLEKKALGNDHYQEKDDLTYWNVSDYQKALQKCYGDDKRRADDFAPSIFGKKWLDVGCGLGGATQELMKLPKFNSKDTQISLVEIQSGALKALHEHMPSHVRIYSAIDAIEKSERFDIITLFHVYEHLDTPIHILMQLRNLLSPEGRIVIEIPHADDILIKGHKLEAFHKFTFWEEHLVLHTKHSLQAFIEEAGLMVESLNGYQRYPLTNHLYWLKEGKPGGHEVLKHLHNDALEDAYQKYLRNSWQTDTLIAICKLH